MALLGISGVIDSSIVSIGLGLDRFLFLEDHDFAGFKLDCERSEEAFSGELAN
jgi:hypothetical protein